MHYVHEEYSDAIAVLILAALGLLAVLSIPFGFLCLFMQPEDALGWAITACIFGWPVWIGPFSYATVYMTSLDIDVKEVNMKWIWAALGAFSAIALIASIATGANSDWIWGSATLLVLTPVLAVVSAGTSNQY